MNWSCFLVLVEGLILLFCCSAAKAQLTVGADIVFVKRSDGKQLHGKITKVLNNHFDVNTVDGKNWQENKKLSDLIKVEWLGKRKVSGYSSPHSLYKFYLKNGDIKTWIITKYPAFQIQYDDGKKWNTSIGSSKLIMLESSKDKLQKLATKDKVKPSVDESKIPRRFRRGNNWRKGNPSTFENSDDVPRSKKRGVTWTRPSPFPEEIGTSVASAGVVLYNSAVAAKIHNQDYDCFKFYFPGGDFVCYSLRNLGLVADLKDVNNQLVVRAKSNNDDKNFRIERYLKPGFYNVTVRVMNHARTGSYVIVFGNGKKQYEEGRVPDQKLVDQHGGYHKFYKTKVSTGKDDF